MLGTVVCLFSRCQNQKWDSDPPPAGLTLNSGDAAHLTCELANEGGTHQSLNIPIIGQAWQASNQSGFTE